MDVLRQAERALLVVGLALLGVAIMANVSGRIQSRLAVKRFDAEQALPGKAPKGGGQTPVLNTAHVDFSSWSEKRIREYEISLAQKFQSPIAVLRIERIRLEVPVFDGTDELVLNRGVGRILGTSRPGENGNIGIAGHRDGFFRGLKDVQPGDTVQLRTAMGTRMYTIDWLRIVNRDDVSVLRTGQNPSLTLVTCYPFYFIGSAPKRYIVHASSLDATSAGMDPSNPVRYDNTTVTTQEKTR